MDGQYCEREQDVVATLCSGASDGQILDHARDCPACAESLRLAELLRTEALPSTYELSTLPDASVIWRKAKARAR